jgi:alcohol dehydrogenase class IV
MNFQYNLPVNLIFGRGRVSETGTVTAQYGARALVVTGRNSTKKSGLLDRALTYLSDAGVEYQIFDEVEPNPLTTTARKGADMAIASGCDVVLGLGGGSIMDAAKAIAFMAVNDGDISDYIFGIKSSARALPIILVPTTCGTGSEGNGFAVLSNPGTNDKKSLRCSAIVAKASIIDPELMLTMPKQVLASVGFDALCHNMEAYLSKIGQPMTDIMALEGIRLVGESLPKVYDNYDDMDAWEKLTWGSTLGGMVIHSAGVTAAHGAEHPASGLRNIVHGLGLAALTPVIYAESIHHAPEKFAVISRLLGGRDETDCVERITALLGKLGLSTSLREQGIQESDIEWMVENCMKVSAAGVANHPAVFSRDDLRRIYRRAL